MTARFQLSALTFTRQPLSSEKELAAESWLLKASLADC